MLSQKNVSLWGCFWDPRRLDVKLLKVIDITFHVGEKLIYIPLATCTNDYHAYAYLLLLLS